MKNSGFVHLHNHTQYSLLDGASRIDDLIVAAKKFNMPALAITDHGNMFGAIEFYKKAGNAGIKPIIGMEAYIAGTSRLDHKRVPGYPDGGFHLVLLAKDQVGYKNLMKLSSIAYREGFYHRPRMDREVLTAHAQGLIVLSACRKGEVPYWLALGDTEKAENAIRFYSELFPGDFYIELQDHGLAEEQQAMPQLVAIAEKFNLPLVATNDCHYLKQEDAEAHDALLCIQTGKVVSDTDRLKYNTDQIYFKSPEEMREMFAAYPAALENTIKIAERCNLEIEMGHLLLPAFPIPEADKTPDEYLSELTRQGMKRRYAEITPEIEERIEYELKVIRQLKYAGYFLIVRDFVDYARTHGVSVGPGRGSAAGSIVSYCLGITNVDPIKYELLFERFLNPERVTMPDIDIDFADRTRGKIIDYVVDKYGRNNVTQIITFGTMAARGVVRDVGRVLGMAYSEVDRIAKMIPTTAEMTLDKALKLVPELQALASSNAQVAKLIALSKTLEGLTRHASTHAAGVVIAPADLTDYVPLFKSNKDEITTQYDMQWIEQVGLLKMDFLGLRTLTVIDDALAMIKSGGKGEINLDIIDLTDPGVFQMFGAGNTIGIFQFESGGMRDYLAKLKPTVLTDLVAMNALYRPGPLGMHMIDTYIDRKQGREQVKYEHPLLEKTLQDTYGVIVFQEQVLKIANLLAGYSLGQADLLRKAMGKKDVKIMNEQKKSFIEGAVKHKVNKKTAESIFDQIEAFAGYGFNRAHATCYALLAYQTAWLKVYYPHEFMAASLTSEMGDSDRVVVLMEECRRMGIEILPPDVNESDGTFTVVGGKIRFGLQAIKNVGGGPVDQILNARHEGGRFTSLADFVSRVDPHAVNKRALESMIAAGAFDSLHGNRRAMNEVLEAMIAYGQMVQRDTHTVDMFGGGVDQTRKAPEFPAVEDLPLAVRLNAEKEMLGFYVSGHPLTRYRRELARFASRSSQKITAADEGKEARVGGIIQAIKTTPDKRGNQMAFVTIEDFTGSLELILFSDSFEKAKEFIVVDGIILASGRISTREGQAPKLLTSSVVPLNRLTEFYDCRLVLQLDREDFPRIGEVRPILEAHPGEKDVIILARKNGEELQIRPRGLHVSLHNDILEDLRRVLGESKVFLVPAGSL